MEVLEEVAEVQAEIQDTAEETAAVMAAMEPQPLQLAMEVQARGELLGPGEVRLVRYIPVEVQVEAIRLPQRKLDQAEALVEVEMAEQEI